MDYYRAFQRDYYFSPKLFSVLKLASNALICLVLSRSTTPITCQKYHSSQCGAQELKIPLHVYFKDYLTCKVARESKTYHDINTVPLSCIDYTRLLQIPSKFVQFQFYPFETTGSPGCSKGKRKRRNSHIPFTSLFFFQTIDQSSSLYMCVF